MQRGHQRLCRRDQEVAGAFFGEAKFRDINEWIGRSQKEINDRFKIYDERSNSVSVSRPELREQAESHENIKVQLLRFSEIGALEAEIRRINVEAEANSRSGVEIEEPSRKSGRFRVTSRRASSIWFQPPT